MDDLNSLNPGGSLPEPLDSIPPIQSPDTEESLDPTSGGFKSSIPGIPVSLPGFALHTNDSLSTNALTKDLTSVYGSPNLNPINYPLIMGGEPIEAGRKPPPQQAGFFEHIGHAFWQNNMFAQAGEYGYDTYQKMMTIGEDPEDFNQFDFNEFKDFPQNYWPDIAGAVNAMDRRRIQQNIRDQMDTEQRFQSGGLVPDLIGGTLGFATGSVGGLFSIASAGRYASVTQNVLQNVVRAAPMLAADSVVRQGLIGANTYGQSVEDTAINTMADLAFNATLFGAGKAIEAGGLNMKLWNSRKIVSPISEGVNMDFAVNEKGEVTGIRATVGPGYNLSAAKLDKAQSMANEAFAQTGLLALPGSQHVLKAVSFGSPVIKAATSPFTTVKGFFNRVTSHGLITGAEEGGLATGDQAYTISKFYQDQGLVLGNWIKGKYYQANGIESGGTYMGALKNLKQTFSNNQTISFEDFGQEVRRAMTIEGYKSKTSQVNEVAETLQKYFDQINVDHHKAMGEDGKFLDPRNAYKYLPTNYNIPQMLARPDKWVQITADAYKRQHETIRSVMRPIDKSDARIKELRSSIKATNKSDPKLRDYQNQLRAAKVLRDRQQRELIERIHTDKDLHILLEDRIPFTPEELTELKALHEPFNRVNAEIQKHSDEMMDLRKSVEELQAQSKAAGRSKEAQQVKAELKSQIDKLEHEAKLREGRISKAEEKLRDLKDELSIKEMEGKLDKKFYKYGERGDPELIEPIFKPKFRAIPMDDRGRFQLAQQVYDSITNQTSDDIMASLFGHSHGAKDRPDYLKNRSHLVDQSIYIEDNFLDPDISKSVSAYSGSMGKVIGWNKAFEHKGPEYWVDSLKSELSKKKDAIPHPIDSPEHQKAMLKLDKQFRTAEKFMNDTYKVYMGTYNSGVSPRLQALSHTMRNIVASAKLGSVPIYQLTELSYLALKSSIMPFLAQGIRPLIKAVFTQAKDPEWQAIRKNAADWYIGLNHLTQSTGQLFGSTSQSFVHGGSFMSAAASRSEQLAHIAGDLYGINVLANINEIVSSNAFQSEIMRAAFAHQNGTLTSELRTKMAHIGVDMDEWATKFINQYNKSKGWKVAGGYQSNAYLWDDLEASERMRISVRRAVEDTLVNRDIFSKPYYLANSPIASMIFMFHGWAYGALSRYTLPTLQRADAKTLAGVASVVASSMMSEPLLRLANGKDMFEDDETWMQAAFKAIDYSGMLGPTLTYAQDINKMLGGTVMPESLIAERYKAQPGFSAALGPVAGYIDNGLRIGSHALKGDLNKTDANRFVRMMPFLSGMPQRAALNHWIDSLDLPERRSDVEPWAWYSALHEKQ